MRDTHFEYFLEQLAQRMTAFDNKWFRDESAVVSLLSGILDMIEQNKVPGSFDKSLCDSLLD